MKKLMQMRKEKKLNMLFGILASSYYARLSGEKKLYSIDTPEIFSPLKCKCSCGCYAVLNTRIVDSSKEIRFRRIG